MHNHGWTTPYFAVALSGVLADSRSVKGSQGLLALILLVQEKKCVFHSRIIYYMMLEPFVLKWGNTPTEWK